MIRLALIYLAIVVVIAGIFTGAPWVFLGRGSEAVTLLPDGPEPLAVLRGDGQAGSAADRLLDSLPEAAGAAVPAPVLRPEGAGLEQTTATILRDLALLKAGDPEQVALQRMSSGAIEALNGLRGQAAAPVTLEGLVAQALREGQTDAYIDALVNEAAGAGRISVPEGLMTAGGKVDTAVLLAALLREAQAAARNTPAQVAPPPEATAQGQTYIVREGDSLGAIALHFYGSMALYPVILKANADRLAGPDRLTRGQELRIPALGAP
ncbi:LysM peptidoglycan-binding domain-containing protein [Gemmobacter caeruleus]|uniref:LysM peptidoglycan-binding domain-containing protein n=1 Tax=Gemmobacter caeruleus TaxID=2595004 RepID=UPI0011EBFCC8|nr:LysM peptidoglycan-binding domain-containing protein [Gemmobacter caeruleus]